MVDKSIRTYGFESMTKILFYRVFIFGWETKANSLENNFTSVRNKRAVALMSWNNSKSEQLKLSQGPGIQQIRHPCSHGDHLSRHVCHQCGLFKKVFWGVRYMKITFIHWPIFWHWAKVVSCGWNVCIFPGTFFEHTKI